MRITKANPIANVVATVTIVADRVAIGGDHDREAQAAPAGQVDREVLDVREVDPAHKVGAQVGIAARREVLDVRMTAVDRETEIAPRNLHQHQPRCVWSFCLSQAVRRVSPSR